MTNIDWYTEIEWYAADPCIGYDRTEIDWEILDEIVEEYLQ